MLKFYKSIFISCLLCLPFLSGAQTSIQNKKPAHLCFYRSDKMLCNKLNFDLQLNKIDIFTLKPTLKKNSALEYFMYSEGRLNITVRNWMNDWVSNIALNVVPGETYYIKIDCAIGGIYLSTNKANGEIEWPQIAQTNLSSLYEDPNTPIITKDTEAAVYTSQNSIQITKVDTVKQIVYVNKEQRYSFTPQCDVDIDIPNVAMANDMAFAVIIGNEDYKSFQPDLGAESNVDFARNDASAFKEYAIKVLGIPEKNITFLLDATYGQISQALTKMNLIAKNTSGKASITFFYAGHGMPDEVNKEPYLVPVDISGANISHGVKLKDVYSKLSEFPTERVCIFMDACFTGGARGEGLVAGRSISIKPKEQLLKGNMVVFSSSSGNQSSLSYPAKKHGLYTYYLLKKLQETGGELTLKDLSFYLKEKVGLESLIINNKEQNPQTNTSAEVATKWEKWKMVK